MVQKRPALIVHGHFYQPPRENPWTGIIEREPSATPFVHWNERIYQECYRTNAYARVLDDHGHIERIVNNYGAMSFNFGPTLLRWLQRSHPKTYARILAADRHSVTLRGHGNAIAQGYNHTILPLCNDRDLFTQIRWGIADFWHRFGRQPEAMWMPETACDDRVLGALIDEGMRFALLAPGQAQQIRRIGDEHWQNVEDGSIDTGRAYRYLHRDGSGRSLALFFYDGSLSRAIAFEGVLASSFDLLNRCEAASNGPGSLVHAVTDGESYGHHFSGGERCLAYSLEVEAPQRGFWVTNYGEWLDRYPAEWDVEIKPGADGLGTAWSCSHGVGRWFRDCGCHTGAKPGWNQQWRTPLRDALNQLRDEAADFYEQAAEEFSADHWAMRDDYIELLLEPDENREQFFAKHTRRKLGEFETTRCLELLEMQRSSLHMFTSCGWFFNDISGIETVQIMRYAGRLLDQLERLGAFSPLDRLLAGLAEAESNIPGEGNGADVYRREVQPTRVTTASIAANIGMASLAGDHRSSGQMADHQFELRDLTKRQISRLSLATARVALRRLATGTEQEFAMAALHFGGFDVYCVLKPFENHEAFTRSTERLWSQFDGASLLTILRIAEEEFGPVEYGLEHVLPEGRHTISESILAERRGRLADAFERLFEDNRRVLSMVHEAGLPVPDELRAVAEITLSRRFEKELERQGNSAQLESYRPLMEIANEAQRYGYELRSDAARAQFEAMLESLVHRLCKTTDGEDRTAKQVESALDLLELIEKLGLDVQLERVQERIYETFGRGVGLAPPVQRLMVALGFSERLLGLQEARLLEGPGSRRTSVRPASRR